MRALARYRGFTLIELLTVIAIIGVLAAILIPVVGSIREKTAAAKSVSNLRQMGQGLEQVMLEGAPGIPAGFYPSFGGIDATGAEYNWPLLIGSQLGLLAKVDNEYSWLIDPNGSIFKSPLNETELTAERTGIPSSSGYGYNAQYLCGNKWADAREGLGTKKLTSGGELVSGNLSKVQIVHPSRMVVFAESEQDGKAQHRIGRDTPPSKAYNNGGHYYFADGHVEFMEFDYVMTNFNRYFTPKSAQLKSGE